MKNPAKDGSQNATADRLYSKSAKYLVIARHSEGVKRVVTPQPHQLRTDALLGPGLDDSPARGLEGFETLAWGKGAPPFFRHLTV